MEFFAPADWAEALQAKAAHPDAVPIAGGTDVMVGLNFDPRRPTALLDLGRVEELKGWEVREGVVRIGAAVTFARLLRPGLADRLPALATAARTVGSPQIRNRATIGGNLGTSSPAGDAHPVLLASGAVVEAESVRGVRLIPIGDFFTGVKRNALAPDELIRAVSIPEAAGPQQFAKVGTRNAMVIAVCSLALSVDVSRHTIGTGIGSAGPRPLTALDAELFLADEMDWDRLTVRADAAEQFGRLVARAASPIDDVRGTAAYRRHALSVLAVRTLSWMCRGELADL
jgi:CO/xanthine dehydrogenase FAD-binding subunit